MSLSVVLHSFSTFRTDEFESSGIAYASSLLYLSLRLLARDMTGRIWGIIYGNYEVGWRLVHHGCGGGVSPDKVCVYC